MKVCILFGGTGYIGTKIVQRFLDTNRFDLIIQADIRAPLAEFDNVTYIFCDVREAINIELANVDLENSWIFNLAAIHREPGHDQAEYFDTNILGANNIIAFANRVGFKNIYFTSSIAPYGRSLLPRTEESMLYSETPYGISKGYAECLHKLWQLADNSRKLVICRPSVIYGPGDPGNILRMIRGIIYGTFFYPGNPDIIKAYGYIYGLLDSIDFVCFDKSDKSILYNYSEHPILTMRELGEVIKLKFNIKRKILSVPIFVLIFVASIFQIVVKLCRKTSSIHPVRVRKAGFPTNVIPLYLIENGFVFKYGFLKSLEHWMSISPEDFK